MNNKLKFGFYVSRTATRLCNFIEAQLGEDRVAFVLIDCKTNYRLTELCKNHNIPLYQYSYQELGLTGKEQNKFISDTFMNLMIKYNVNYSFIFGSRILQGELLHKFQWRLINFHPAVLPAFKGKKAIDQAIEYGALLTGNTAHFIDENLDAGIMIIQNLFPIHKFTNYDDVLNKQIPMMLQIMQWLDDNRIHIRNNRAIVEGAKYEIGEFIPALEIELTTASTLHTTTKP